ncbi:chemotaxis protein CheB [soil metagenome]
MEENAIGKFRVLIIGGSAGSLDVIIRIVGQLPKNIGLTTVIIVHRKNEPDSILQSLLTSKTTIPVKEVEDKEPILANTIYIAPPDYHLLVENESQFSLDSSEKIHYSRPSIDVGFESAAVIFKDSLVAVLLSGANADGARGLRTVQLLGGYTIVENPATAEVNYMPQEAIKLSKLHHIVDGKAIPGYLHQLLLKPTSTLD